MTFSLILNRRVNSISQLSNLVAVTKCQFLQNEKLEISERIVACKATKIITMQVT